MALLPSFIAFTGVDDPQLLSAMQALSARYPIEWGILVDDAQADKRLFPDATERDALLSATGLRWAAHVCGEQARLIANDPDKATVDVTRFQRVQVNHSFSGSSAAQIECTVRFGRKHGVRTMLQGSSDFPADARLDWLFDTSFGTGVAAARWPALPANGPFCGYSGGIKPDTAGAVVAAIGASIDTGQYWIDMESGVRTDDRFDLAKCEAVCRAVYG
ncbi:hypothetical protein U5A82_04745 [Sphingobium sp. CR2-8]|uniref:hypothetical protein n=1 Tax=Sphingobium sp. CR2-8 TaxID=1306534 RepID=UPI002DBB0F8D|nr:hypothetical protein [Sphingobium sp. CR2-8]MEC3909800.1 hypothetical protein [Sphingobium sp. CR2-8]